MKFTFKTDRPTGPWSSFYDNYYHIKLLKQKVGSIEARPPHRILFKVIKKDINEDGNPNCNWKWIRLKKEFNSVDEAKIFLNENIDSLIEQFNLNFENRKPKKKLKIWNGRGHGKYSKHHIYVAAYSRAEAARLVSRACANNDNFVPAREIRDYYHEGAWGNVMNGIEPIEPCVYISDEYEFGSNNTLPKRVI